jgi:hypothetical protein
LGRLLVLSERAGSGEEARKKDWQRAKQADDGFHDNHLAPLQVNNCQPVRTISGVAVPSATRADGLT